MKKNLFGIISLLSFSLMTGIARSEPAPVFAEEPESLEYVEDRIIVSMTNEESRKFKEYGPEDFPELPVERVVDLTSSSYQAFLAREKETEPTEFGDSLSIDRFNRILRLDLEGGSCEPTEALKIIGRRDDVLNASLDYILEASSASFNDPLASDQWAINKLQLPDVWDIMTGSRFVSVGVIDTGIQADHPDLINNVDLSKCVDTSSGTPVGIGTSPYLTDHGTHVAAIIEMILDFQFTPAIPMPLLPFAPMMPAT